MHGTPTSGGHNRSSWYHGEHSGSTFMQEQLPKTLGNEKPIAETVNIAPLPPPLPPPPQSSEKNQVTLKLPNSATAGSQHKKSFVFTPHDYTQSKINREDIPYPAKMMQITQIDAPSIIHTESHTKHVAFSTYTSDEDDTIIGNDVKVIAQRKNTDQNKAPNPALRLDQINPLAHSTAIHNKMNGTH
jgi:hypothetical protein